MNATMQHAKDIFTDLIGRVPPAEWDERLAAMCGGDERLGRRVRALLKAHREAGSFLDKPAVAAEFGLTVDRPLVERPGTSIGPYKLLEQIGEGGFGVVYMAEQSAPMRRRVALKVLKPGMDTRQVIARFEAERQALALMDHPNIAKVFDGGTTGEMRSSECGVRNEPAEEGSPSAAILHSEFRTPHSPTGRPYFVMELVRGVPLTEFCDQNHLNVRERLELFLTVCQAVQHAHLKGVIHRDLKPSNVLVTLHDGVPVAKVIDFGIAKATAQPLTDKTLFTNYAQMIGTPLYMSPEQAELSGLDVDTRSDIYSLGVMLYELLTGTTPFDKERLKAAGYDEIRRLIREEEPETVSSRLARTGNSRESMRSAECGVGNRGRMRLFRRFFAPHSHVRIPHLQELDWIVMKALEKDRNRRYETASAFAADVERYLRNEPVQACPPSAWYRACKFAHRNKAALATATAVAAGMLIAVASLSGAVYALAASNTEIKQEQQHTKDALDREKRTNDALVQSLQREQLALYFQRIALAEREMAARNVGRAEELLEDCPPRLRNWEWSYLKRRCRQEPFTFHDHVGPVAGVDFSPDGKTVASTSWSQGLGEVLVWDRASGRRLHRLLGHSGTVGNVAFSPDGKRLASSGEDKTLRIWDTASGAQLRLLRHPEGLSCLDFSPDGKFLVAGGVDNTMTIRDAADFQVLRVLRGHEKIVHSAAFGPDGRLASASFDGTIRVWDAATGEEVHIFRGHAGPALGVAFSRDGSRVASTGLDGTARVWDARTGRHVLTIRAENILTTCVAFSPDGTRLATGSNERAVRVWDLASEQEVLTLRGHSDTVWAVAFSPDGDQLASTSLDGTVKVWDAGPLGSRTQSEERTLRGHTGAVLSVAFRPSGAEPARRPQLASASQDETVKLWDATAGDELRALRGHTGPVGFVTFSRDGRRLASIDFAGNIKVWDAETGQEVRSFQGTVGHPALSPDGRHVAYSAIPATVQIRDVETGAEVLAPFVAHMGPVMGIAYSPDGKRLATSGWDHTAAVWDVETGRRLHTLSGHRHNVNSVVFSEDGSRLATASWDDTAKVWDAATGQELFTLRGHEDNVFSLKFSPDGKRLATASGDNTVRIWDAMAGEEVAVLRGHAGQVLSVAFSPDGKQLASASGYRGKGEVKIWDASLWNRIAAEE